jgi:hypothetical protein
MSLNPMSMNWAESAFQKIIYFLLIATLVVADVTLFPVFDQNDTKGRILNMFLQFFILYVATIWFSKIFLTVGRHIR